MMEILLSLKNINNSNTTLVKVKYDTELLIAEAITDSNTTLVKVKFFTKISFRLYLFNSNTTLVKVKFRGAQQVLDKEQFKYNTC